jgi:hypothetical protein
MVQVSHAYTSYSLQVPISSVMSAPMGVGTTCKRWRRFRRPLLEKREKGRTPSFFSANIWYPALYLSAGDVGHPPRMNEVCVALRFSLGCDSN